MATNNEKKSWWNFVQTELVYTVLCCVIARLIIGNDIAAKDLGTWQPVLIKIIDTTAIACFILGAKRSLTMFSRLKKGHEDIFNPDQYADPADSSTGK